ncbi:Tau-tubulin kinase 1 [Trichinella zimbabwensis]|uniref:Tau-tubulin kinase 1 n=2 Tax=Trichinella zimbabwensis TaxID=268475 RepID=A0A0V1HWX0_9BILA|nr:Tau-tubulin kinase 1 [Trichinella zimbabwensis]
MENSVPNIVEINEVLVGINETSWQVKSYLGKGCFGAIVLAVNKKTGQEAALKTLEGISDLHRAGFLHRDIKPANFAIGLPPNCRQIYILDFGMSRKYLKKDGRHRRPRETAKFRGTPFYASPVALKEGEQARRDDVWAWFFMTIEFTVEKLPWDKTLYRGATLREKLKDMAEDRQFYVENSDKLLTGCPKQFFLIYEHLNKLQYSDAPDYEAIIKAIKAIYIDQGIDINSPLQYEN